MLYQCTCVLLLFISISGQVFLLRCKHYNLLIILPTKIAFLTIYYVLLNCFSFYSPFILLDAHVSQKRWQEFFSCLHLQVMIFKYWFDAKEATKRKEKVIPITPTSICICHRSELAFTSAWLYLNLKYVGSLSWMFSFADQANKIWLTRCSLTCELIGKLKVPYLNWLTNKCTYSCYYDKQMTAVRPFCKRKNTMGIFFTKWVKMNIS